MPQPARASQLATYIYYSSIARVLACLMLSRYLIFCRQAAKMSHLQGISHSVSQCVFDLACLMLSRCLIFCRQAAKMSHLWYQSLVIVCDQSQCVFDLACLMLSRFCRQAAKMSHLQAVRQQSQSYQSQSQSQCVQCVSQCVSQCVFDLACLLLSRCLIFCRQAVSSLGSEVFISLSHSVQSQCIEESIEESSVEGVQKESSVEGVQCRRSVEGVQCLVCASVQCVFDLA